MQKSSCCRRTMALICILMSAWALPGPVASAETGADAVYLRHVALVVADPDSGCSYIERTLEEVVPLTKRGVLRYGELIVSFRSDWESVRVIRAESRPRGAGRRTLEALTSESPHRSLSPTDRLESSLREISILFQGLEVGDTLLIETERRIHRLPLADFYSYSFFFEARDSIAQALFTVDWPTDRTLHSIEILARTAPQQSEWTEQGGSRRILRWVWSGSSPVPSDVLDIPLWERLDRIVLASATPEEISSGLAARIDPLILCEPDPVVSDLLDTLPASPDSLRSWVARNITLIGGDSGEFPGYDPRTPSETITDACGVCRDKAVLLAHLLTHSGYEAGVALMNSSRRLDPLMGIRSFDHMITFCYPRDRESGELIALDPTEPYTEERLPAGLRGSSCLPLTEPGSGLEDLPDPVGGDTLLIGISGRFGVDGSTGFIDLDSVRIVAMGAPLELIREMMTLIGADSDSAASLELLRRLFLPWPGCRLEALQNRPGAGSLFLMRAEGRLPLNTIASADGLIACRIPGLPGFSTLGSRLSLPLLLRNRGPSGENGARRMMIDAPLNEVLELSIDLGDARVASLPEPVLVPQYGLEWERYGDTLLVLRESFDITPVRPGPDRAGAILEASSLRCSPVIATGRVVVFAP